jgi:O-antigen/teichoic acid export membrane protein
MGNYIRHRVQSIMSDPFWKNVTTLFTGSVIAQALPILFFPILTRIYTKEVLGIYFVFAAIGLLTQIIASFQYQLAIVLPKNTKDANHLLTINLIMVTSVSLLMLLIIWGFSDFILSLIEQKDLKNWLFYIPLSTFFLGTFNAISYYFNRFNNYKTISLGRVIKSVVFLVFQIGLGLLGYKYSGLIVGYLIGQGASLFFLFFYLFNEAEYKIQINMRDIKRLVLEYKDIPLFNTLISFLNTLSNQLPMFVLTRYFGAAAAGEYGLANRTISTPMGLIGQSVGQVFYQEAARLKNQGNSLENLVKTTYKRLLKIGIIPFILLALFSPWIFKIVFSNEYYTSGEITRLLIPWLFVMFLNSPLSFIITVLNKQKVMVAYDTFLLAFRFFALWAGYYFFDSLLIAIGFYSLVGFVFNALLLFYFLKISKQKAEIGYA